MAGRTGGTDGIYFPMKMTSLQKEPFNINLYVFYKDWLNDQLSKYGYAHRGFTLKHRDWDTHDCIPNAGNRMIVAIPYKPAIYLYAGNLLFYFRNADPSDRACRGR